MKTFDMLIVTFIVLSALFFLYKVFKPKPYKGGGCGCGTVDCKAPKPKLQSPP